MSPLILVNCAETRFVANLIKAGTENIGQPVAGHYKIGGPYQIKGIWYRPRVDYKYDKTGIASWYGSKFHGKRTANGEIFDMNLVSAAHKTLPMPSMVRVTNLRNGKALNIRLNDRGPFAHGRIIDLSRRAAQLLDFEIAGTAPVRVQVLEQESRLLASAGQGVILPGTALPGKVNTATDQNNQTPRSAPSISVTREPLLSNNDKNNSTQVRKKPNNGGNVPHVKRQLRSPLTLEVYDDETVTEVVVKPNSQIYVQAGAYSQYVNANRVQVQLGELGSSKISKTKEGKDRLFRVRLGPYENVELADKMLVRVMGFGYPGARIIID